MQKYEVAYYRCRQTGFIQTEEPYWLEEAYATPIAELDIGYVHRNIEMASFSSGLIDRCFPGFITGLDFGGGYGMFVRRMRDLGYDFFTRDPYTKNLFAKDFESPASDSRQFSVVTAFEVFEHSADPPSLVRELLALAPTIVLSTDLQPCRSFQSASDWWYFAPETGQHLSFFTCAALNWLAKEYGLHFYTNSRNLHVLSKDALTDPFPPPSCLTLRERVGVHLKRVLMGNTATQHSRPSLLKRDHDQLRSFVAEQAARGERE